MLRDLLVNNGNISDSEIIYQLYQHREDGRRIAYLSRNYTNATRSDVRFRRKVLNACRKLNFKVFGTLSYKDEFLPYSSRHVSKFFEKWRKYNIRTVKKKKVEYVWREDFGKINQRPHFHFFASDYADWRKIRDWWGRGMIWVRKIYDMNEAKRYLYKYMCKKREEGQFKRHRYGSSQGVPKVPPSDWKFCCYSREEDVMENVYVWNQNLGHVDMFLGSKKFRG